MKRRSRLVRIPTRRPVLRDRHPRDPVTSPSPRAPRPTGRSGGSVIGSAIIPLSDRLTLSTSEACSSIVRFLWITPIPPSRARAMARRVSVTVSMAAESSGIPKRSLGVSWTRGIDLAGQHIGLTAESAGRRQRLDLPPRRARAWAPPESVRNLLCPTSDGSCA